MAITNQITPSGQQPYSSQCNFGQLIGRVNGYNSACSPSVVQNLINDVVRRIYDRRDGRWTGLLTKGQIISSGYTTGGSVTLTSGSPNVTGVGTSFTSSLVGQQLRVGFTAPIYTIVSVPSTTSLVLELPWGMPNQTATGYYITQYYYSFPNVRAFHVVKNLQLMYRMHTGVPVQSIDTWDPSRLQMFFSRVVAQMPPDANGNYQVELWPAPSVAQAFPYLAWVQPPNLVNDSDPLPPFVRTDIVESGAIAEVLIHNPKNNPGYSETLALSMSERFRKQFEAELDYASRIDEGLYRQDYLAEWETWPLAGLDFRTGQYIGGGAYLQAMSPTSAYEEDY